MIVDAGTASTTSGPQLFALSRYTPSGSLDSGNTPEFTTLTAPGSADVIGKVGILSESAQASYSAVLDSGFVLQAMESPDFFPSMLNLRRRR